MLNIQITSRRRLGPLIEPSMAWIQRWWVLSEANKETNTRNPNFKDYQHTEPTIFLLSSLAPFWSDYQRTHLSVSEDAPATFWMLQCSGTMNAVRHCSLCCLPIIFRLPFLPSVSLSHLFMQNACVAVHESVYFQLRRFLVYLKLEQTFYIKTTENICLWSSYGMGIPQSKSN